jgi:hypothetical protein
MVERASFQSIKVHVALLKGWRSPVPSSESNHVISDLETANPCPFPPQKESGSPCPVIREGIISMELSRLGD